MTIEHYTHRNEHVNPLTAELLDSAFALAGIGWARTTGAVEHRDKIVL